jgi:hypothetical protein
MKRRLVLLLLLALAHCAAGQEPRFEPKVVLLDGQSLPLKEVSIAGGKVTGDGLPEKLTLDDLRQIDVAPATVPPKAQAGIHLQLVGGGLVRAASLTIENDVCQVVTFAGDEKLGIPLERLRAVRFDPALKSEAIDKAIAAPSAEVDRIFVKVDDAVESIGGITVALTDSDLKAQIEGAEQTIPRSRLVSIVVTQPSGEDELANATVTLRDGSKVPGEIQSLAEGKLTLAMPPGGKVDISWAAVANVTIRSRRVAYLSDLKPTGLEQRSITFLDVPWKRDRSVLGRPLIVGNRTFEKGIGAHATSKLTFEAGGRYDELAAEIGIDAETGGKGDCVFTVLADGESIFSQRMKGSDPPAPLRVDIRGKKEITLVVEAGEGLDLADHADWCDVRFIQKATTP